VSDFGGRGGTDHADDATMKGKPSLFIVGGVIAVVLAVAVIVVATSGGGDNAARARSGSSTSTSPAITEPLTSPPTTTVPPQQTSHVGDRVTDPSGTSVQLYRYEQPVQAQHGFLPPGAGSEYAVADVAVCAGARAPAGYSIFGWTVQTPDGRVYEPSISARKPALGSGAIPAKHGCVRGWVTFALPVGQRAAFVIWKYYTYQHVKWAV
jgi:hypothetical protein